MWRFRVWIETLWFQKFWDVHRDYAEHLALKNERDRRQDRANGLPEKGCGVWALAGELLCQNEE